MTPNLPFTGAQRSVLLDLTSLADKPSHPSLAALAILYDLTNWFQASDVCSTTFLFTRYPYV
jgi:hypothetical protein